MRLSPEAHTSRPWRIHEIAPEPFHPVYLTHDEWASELANQTVHTVMHVGWVPDDSGVYRAQMAVLVKPNGLFGRAYMAGIRPFRHLIVYGQVMQGIARRWQDSAAPQPAEPRHAESST